MNDSWRVFIRDIKRILAVPRSLIIVIGILVMPALYSWLNILAFWNPYTATGNLPIAVVNNDEGTNSALTGKINVGDLIVEELSHNDQLGWQFLDESVATDRIRAGDVYATFVIPPSFSEDLVEIFSGERNQPTIEYLVNEKKGAIAPKITDAGANELDIQITSTFREQVGQAIVQGMRDGSLKVSANINSAESSALGALGGVEEDLGQAQATLDAASVSLTDSLQTMGNVRSALAAADPALADISEALADSRAVLETVVSDAQDFAVSAGKASASAQQALNQSSASASAAVSNTTARLNEMQPQLQGGIERANASLDAVRERVKILEQIPAAQDAAQELNSRLDDAQDLLNKVSQSGKDAATATKDLDELVKSFNDAIAATQDVTNQTQNLAGEAVSKLTTQVTDLSARLGGVDSAITTTRASLTQVFSLVDGVEEQIGATQGVLAQAKGNLGGLAGSVRVAQTDVATLAAAIQTGTLQTVIGLDAQNIGRYLASPVEFDQQPVFQVNSYGSGMAALFINLSMWIGGLILVIIFRVEVDKEGFDWLPLRSAYMGRFMLSGALSMAQGLIVSVGSLMIGVQTANVLAFIATATLIGPIYFAIIYALAAALSHVGRALAILLVVLQIPGASGIYPIELMPGFFRGLYPLLPFSYGIDAMRETIGGFYAGHYWRLMAIPLLMSTSALLLGFLGRRHLGYFTQLFYNELARTELVVNEDVQLQGTVYRLSNIIALLSNRKEFSNRIAYRQERFNSHYRVLINGLSVVGVLGFVALSLVSSLTAASKSALLGLVAVWGLVIIGALVATEGLRSSLQRANDLSHLSEDELFDSLARPRSEAERERAESEARQ
ncbi:YhgE/Pip domain-containing protein [Gleimia europaea]|uniref:YhgE/Pip domain-containing protein n=1 Tax=Gleimia europaea ACS-120-V-Col10b TaxID=883069 RepID=A0A9W5VVT5_9ACTO|nr:YhgE/Pip domain-containing protein [Gleimia europaea]EPD29506.1 YhgE/Pip domain-containing protein [Gleimia europaea ACS-120-V-Col10b]